MPFFISRTRKITLVKDAVAEHFQKYKSLYILFLIVMIAGILVGIVAGVQKSSVEGLKNLPDMIWCKYLLKETSVWQLFLSRFFSFLCMCCICWFLAFNRWVSLLSLLLIIYNAFILGAMCSILVCSFKFVGFLNMLLVYLPFHLISLLCLVCFCVVCVRYSFDACKTSYSVLSFNFFQTIKSIIVLVFASHLLSCLIELIILPWFSATILIS